MKFFYFTFLFLFLTTFSSGQVLNRQVLSNNGISVVTKSGFFVSHTVGQTISSQTIKNSSTNIQQGFQQSLFPILNIENNNLNKSFVINAYPNPFRSFIKVDFSEDIVGDIEVRIIDVLGRVVYTSSLKLASNSFIIGNLDFLSTGNYFLSLSTTDFKYTNQFIKNN
jgi:hypothetical protein